MNHRILPLLLLLFGFFLFQCGNDDLPARQGRTPVGQADRPKEIVVGANYINRGAINQLEMWQAGDFDPAQIDEELGWAAELGMNSMRVYLHNLLWEADSTGFLGRIDRYLEIADGHGMTTTFVLFDAVWNPESELGPQPAPRPHTHNSGWVQSPPKRQLEVGDTSHFPVLESYVKGVIGRFADDERVYMWDLYNEPDNDNFGKFPLDTAKGEKLARVFPLLVKSFQWAREVAPRQPLTSGVWHGELYESGVPDSMARFQLENSDVISYHWYGPPEGHAALIDRLEAYGRPLVCTEYMARPVGSTFQNTLPMLVERGVGAYHWGLVSGKSQTIYPWSSWEETFTDEPEVWFHDVFRADGTLYAEEEGEVFEGIRR